MPKLNGTGPDGQGSGTGRKLGKCNSTPDEAEIQKLGKGMGQRRKSGGGKGAGKRQKSNKQ